MKRYILTLLSCVLALVAYGADDSNTIGKMRDEGNILNDMAKEFNIIKMHLEKCRFYQNLHFPRCK